MLEPPLFLPEMALCSLINTYTLHYAMPRDVTLPPIAAADGVVLRMIRPHTRYFSRRLFSSAVYCRYSASVAAAARD